jgi:hypothetical protein
MRNIHLVKTEKPSRIHLFTDETGSRLKLCELEYSHTRNTQNIYITNNEYIGLSYYLDGNLVRKSVMVDKDYWEARKDYKKIILTTDPDLIEDGVQSIDDEFLEWFIKNLSCEEIEVKSESSRKHGIWKPEYYSQVYKIIIPKEEPNYNMKQEILDEIEILKEEPKQETLEEAAENYVRGCLHTLYDFKKQCFLDGVKWQQEQDMNNYSLDEIKLAMKDSYALKYFSETKFLENLKQFKKK